MDIDNLTDIDLLRKLAKENRVKMKKDLYAEDNSQFIFKANSWYRFEQNNGRIIIYDFLDDKIVLRNFNYKEAEEYLYSK